MADQKTPAVEIVENDSTFSAANSRPVGVSPGNAGDFAPVARMPERFAAINRMIMRDLNGITNAPTFFKYNKDEIASYLKNPYTNEKQLRNAVTYLYGASAHFRRLIQYFVSLSDLSYVVSPYKTDTSTAKPESVKRNYRRVLNLLSSMDIKNTFEKVLTVCLREDVFYGTLWETNESVILQQLPSDYCAITVVEDNVPNITFDFSYFDSFSYNLPLYPAEFQQKFNLYKKDSRNYRWQELDAPNSFAVKANKDILNYAMPPFAGILREIYDLEDYKGLKLAKTELENYAMLVMHLGVDDQGQWQMNYNKAVQFYHNLDSVLPEEVGSVLSPFPIDKISFERNHAGDTDTIAEAEQNLYTAAGVQSLLFNNARASSNALLLSIKVDQALTFSIVKSIEAVLNRFIHRHGFGKYFKVTFLDCSPFNRKELADGYLRAAQYGIPTVSYYCAANGISQDDMDGLNFLEDTVLGIKERFVPLKGSNQLSSGYWGTGRTGRVGRPRLDIGDLSDAGEITREVDEQ